MAKPGRNPEMLATTLGKTIWFLGIPKKRPPTSMMSVASAASGEQMEACAAELAENDDEVLIAALVKHFHAKKNGKGPVPNAEHMAHAVRLARGDPAVKTGTALKQTFGLGNPSGRLRT